MDITWKISIYELIAIGLALIGLLWQLVKLIRRRITFRIVEVDDSILFYHTNRGSGEILIHIILSIYMKNQTPAIITILNTWIDNKYLQGNGKFNLLTKPRRFSLVSDKYGKKNFDVKKEQLLVVNTKLKPYEGKIFVLYFFGNTSIDDLSLCEQVTNDDGLEILLATIHVKTTEGLYKKDFRLPSMTKDEYIEKVFCV